MEEVSIDVKGGLNWSVGHYLSLYLFHITGYTVGTLAKVLVLVESVVGVVGLWTEGREDRERGGGRSKKGVRVGGRREGGREGRREGERRERGGREEGEEGGGGVG